MTEPVRLIAGLGNPGDAYTHTRHNAGFTFIDVLARQVGAHWTPDKRVQGQRCDVFIGSHKVILVKPMTYMNRSGQSLAPLLNFYKWPTESLLVVHDELDLPAGSARLKKGGGHGGHNGLRDISARLGKAPYYRLRLGIGHPGQARDVVNYVLSKAPASEQSELAQAIDRALDCLPMAVAGQWEKAMHQLHTPHDTAKG